MKKISMLAVLTFAASCAVLPNKTYQREPQQVGGQIGDSAKSAQAVSPVHKRNKNAEFGKVDNLGGGKYIIYDPYILVGGVDLRIDASAGGDSGPSDWNGICKLFGFQEVTPDPNAMAKVLRTDAAAVHVDGSGNFDMGAFRFNEQQQPSSYLVVNYIRCQTLPPAPAPAPVVATPQISGANTVESRLAQLRSAPNGKFSLSEIETKVIWATDGKSVQLVKVVAPMFRDAEGRLIPFSVYSDLDAVCKSFTMNGALVSRSAMTPQSVSGKKVIYPKTYYMHASAEFSAAIPNHGAYAGKNFGIQSLTCR